MFLKKRTENTTKRSYADMPDGYRESIQKGMDMVMRIGRKMYFGRGTKEERIARLKDELQNADCIVIGAGAGLSTAAGSRDSALAVSSLFRSGDARARPPTKNCLQHPLPQRFP